MSAIGAWADMMPDTVTIAPYASQNTYGEETYAAAVTYAARCVGKQQKVIDLNGNERVSTVTSYLLAAPLTLTVRDKITIPSRFGDTTPEIMAISGWPDETGPHHVAVMT